MKLNQKVTQQLQTGLRLTQDLGRAIGFLELSNLELAQSLRDTASDNPWLQLRLPSAIADAPAEVAAQGPSLQAHVLEALPRLVPRAADRAIAMALVDALAPSGLLGTSPEDIAQQQGVPVARVEAVLTALQRIEPRGLFARSLSECLELQLAEMGPIAPPMRRLLTALPLLSEAGPAALAKAADLGAEDLETLLAQLRELDPSPGQGFSTAPVQTRIADLIFEETDGQWQVRLNPETLPEIALAELGPAPDRGSRLAHERGAALRLIGALERRNRALLALGDLLAREQSGFLAHGPAAQRVLTARAAAGQLGMHEGSISRLANSASATIPGMGVLPLRAFFCRAVRRDPDAPAQLAAPAVTARIAEIIAQEDPRRPLDDGRIAAMLEDAGMAVSRRVVGKLRTRAGIANRSARRRRDD